MVLDDDGGGAMEVRVNVDIVGLHVALDQQLVLLSVLAADHEIVLTRHEPEELLEPENLPCFVDRGNLRHLL